MNSANQASAPNSRQFRWRRLFQFRIRSLLILTAVLAVPLGWWGWKIERQRRAMAALQKRGATVWCTEYVHGASYWDRWQWQFTASSVTLKEQPTDDDITALQALDGLEEVECPFSNADIVRLRSALPHCAVKATGDKGDMPRPVLQGTK
jgi:hypothetical protein